MAQHTAEKRTGQNTNEPIVDMMDGLGLDNGEPIVDMMDGFGLNNGVPK